jgi:hypothetical protein
LYTLAGLMITFAGFSALLLAVRPAAGIFVLTGAALLPVLLDTGDAWLCLGGPLIAPRRISRR